MNDSDLKQEVKKRYGRIAVNQQSSCCGTTASSNDTCCGTDGIDTDWQITDEKYKELKGYNSDADLKLGCGMPTEFAKIKEGDTVVDLGSGAGNDVFVARAITGEKGKVIGLDFTKEMIEKAKINNEKMGYKNVDFIFGDIEDMPLGDNTADVVISNCVLNLVPDKEKAFREIYRIIKPGGHFSVSDIVTDKYLPEPLKKPAELYAGCISGAITKDEYDGIIEKAGFRNVRIDKAGKIKLPEELLVNYLSKDEIEFYLKNDPGIMSINVYAEK